MLACVIAQATPARLRVIVGWRNLVNFQRCLSGRVDDAPSYQQKGTSMNRTIRSISAALFVAGVIAVSTSTPAAADNTAPPVDDTVVVDDAGVATTTEVDPGVTPEVGVVDPGAALAM